MADLCASMQILEIEVAYQSQSQAVSIGLSLKAMVKSDQELQSLMYTVGVSHQSV